MDLAPWRSIGLYRTYNPNFRGGDIFPPHLTQEKPTKKSLPFSLLKEKLTISSAS